MKTIYRFTLIVFTLSFFIATSYAQLPAPFAGGVKLQQGGLTNPATGLTMKAKPGYSGEVTLNWVQPVSTGVIKLTSLGAGTGDITITTLDLSSATDVGSSILGILNGGTGANTRVGALNNLLPTQTGLNGEFVKTDGAGTVTWGTAVTSVGLSLPAELSVIGSPVTTTGLLSASWATQAAHTVFAAPIAGGTPSFRTLDPTDIPNLDASKITSGTLPVTRGGTGTGTLTANGIVTVNNAGTALVSTHLNDGELMIGNSADGPTATTLTAGNGVTITNGGGSITISASLSNISNKARYTLNATAYAYPTNTPPAGFILTGNSVITITILEAGGFPITATITNINTVANTFDFILSGFPTAGSVALMTFQN